MAAPSRFLFALRNHYPQLTMTPTSCNQVTKAIRHTGLTLIKGRGYFYFLDAEGNQVGDSVMVYALRQTTVDYWVRWAEAIKADQE
jgi:hypothetical protein